MDDIEIEKNNIINKIEKSDITSISIINMKYYIFS